MRRVTTILALCGLGISGMTAQTFFSVNAGTDGFNFNVTNMPPLFPVGNVAPPPPPPQVHVPLLPGVVYSDYPSRKAYKKAVKRYRKAVRHAAEAIPVMFFPAAYYDDDDYDDYIEEFYEHHHKVKHYKKHKHHKHHKHHHDYDDDDD